MPIPHPHRDAGGYALGVLGAADAFRFEEHLAGCPACAVRVGEFGGVAAQLAAYARRTPPGIGAVVDPGPGLLRALVAAAAAGRRTSRRRAWALAGAAVVLAVGGPAAVVAGAADGGPGSARAERWTGTDTVTGLSAAVTTGAKEWGADVAVEVAGVPVAGVCSLVAVGRDGSEHTVSTWSVAGPAGEPVTVPGGAGLPPSGIDHFEVRSPDGRRLLTVRR